MAIAYETVAGKFKDENAYGYCVLTKYYLLRLRCGQMSGVVLLNCGEHEFLTELGE